MAYFSGSFEFSEYNIESSDILNIYQLMKELWFFSDWKEMFAPIINKYDKSKHFIVSSNTSCPWVVNHNPLRKKTIKYVMYPTYNLVKFNNNNEWLSGTVIKTYPNQTSDIKLNNSNIIKIRKSNSEIKIADNSIYKKLSIPILWCSTSIEQKIFNICIDIINNVIKSIKITGINNIKSNIEEILYLINNDFQKKTYQFYYYINRTNCILGLSNRLNKDVKDNISSYMQTPFIKPLPYCISIATILLLNIKYKLFYNETFIMRYNYMDGHINGTTLYEHQYYNELKTRIKNEHINDNKRLFTKFGINWNHKLKSQKIIILNNNNKIFNLNRFFDSYIPK